MIQVKMLHGHKIGVALCIRGRSQLLYTHLVHVNFGKTELFQGRAQRDITFEVMHVTALFKQYRTCLRSQVFYVDIFCHQSELAE